MSTFIVVKSKPKLCNRTTCIKEFQLTFFEFKKIHDIVRITIQRAFKNVKRFFCFCFLKFCSIFKWIIYFTWVICRLTWFRSASLSNWGKTALTKWSLTLLAFLNPIIGISQKTLLWAWSGASKRCGFSWHL